MSADLSTALFRSPIVGYAYHEILLDEAGKPYDYKFLEVNQTFERLTGLKREALLEGSVRQVLPGIEHGDFDWIAFFGDIALNGLEKEFEQYSELLDKWYRVHAYSTERLYFATIFVDISSSKQQSEELENFFSINLDLLCIADTDGNFIKTNAAWSQILGYSTKDLNTRKFLEFIHPDDMEKTIEAMSQLEKGDEVLSFVNRYRGKDGVYRYIEWRSQAKGKLIYAAARDVTERLENEQELLHAKNKAEESQKYLDLFFSQSFTGFFFMMLDEPVDWQGAEDKEAMLDHIMCHQRVTKVNQAMLDQYAAKKDNFLGLTPNELFAHDLEYARSLWKGLLEKGRWHVQTKEQRLDGTPMYVDGDYTCVYDDQMRFTGIFGVQLDVTEAKQIQEEIRATRDQYQSLVDNIPGITYRSVNDEHRTMLFMSDGAESLIGFATDDFTKNAVRTYESVIHPEDRDFVRQSINAAIAEKNFWDIEYRLCHKDGQIRWGHEKGRAVYDEDEQVLYLDAFVLDNTARKELEQDLQSTNEFLEKETRRASDFAAEAEMASKAKSEFLANMSHEIRTPLNGVIGFTELLKNTPLNTVQQQYVETANASGQTLLNIINDILDFSKIEAGMMTLDLVKTDMFELLEDSIALIQYTANKKGLEVLLDIDVTMPRFVMVDPVRLKQILTNLLGNAVKFTEKGEVELQLVFQQTTNSEGKFQFSVRDTGIGISKAQQKKLFMAFAQADSSTTRQFGGTGLGLIISDLLAEKMGSKITLKSKQGEGSRFSFEIHTDFEFGKPIGQKNELSIQRCLIIDDNENNCLILEQTLKNWGVDTELCHNGLDALKLLETSKPFDVIICDYHMPYIDGLETIQMIREKLQLSAEEQPVLLLHSSLDSSKIQEQTEALGVRARLLKPVKPRVLYDSLCRLHKSERLEQEDALSSKDKEEKTLNTSGKLLIAEDNEVNLLLLTAILENHIPKASILVARNGEEAVHLYKKDVPDIVFMDIQMPVLDGLDACRQIRQYEEQIGSYIPIIALTAGVTKEEQKKCFDAGMDSFLSKPVHVEKLKLTLERFLKKENGKNTALSFDKELFYERLEGSHELFQRLIGIFLHDSPQLLKSIQEFLDKKDYPNLAIQAHQLKGLALNMALPLLADITKKLEHGIAHEASQEKLLFLYKDMEEEWKQVQKHLKQFL